MVRVFIKLFIKNWSNLEVIKYAFKQVLNVVRFKLVKKNQTIFFQYRVN